MDYFTFYDLPVAFDLDTADLKRRFYEKSRALHPDFHTMASPEAQEEALQMAGFNNEAYRTLSDPDRRMKYVLQHKGLLTEGGANPQLPQDFLMEVMDINEVLMELEFDFDEAKFKAARTELAALEARLQEEVAEVLHHYDDAQATPAQLERIKNFYLKKRYLLRMSENLSNFAPQ